MVCGWTQGCIDLERRAHWNPPLNCAIAISMNNCGEDCYSERAYPSQDTRKPGAIFCSRMIFAKEHDVMSLRHLLCMIS